MLDVLLGGSSPARRPFLLRPPPELGARQIRTDSQWWIAGGNTRDWGQRNRGPQGNHAPVNDLPADHHANVTQQPVVGGITFYDGGRMTAIARVLAFPEPVNVGALIREKLAESDIADPHVIAQLVADEVPEADLRSVLAKALADSVRRCIHGQRTPRPLASRGSAPRSARWSAVAERAEEIDVFRQRVCPAGTWKFLGECSADDLDALVAEHRDLAARNEARAAQYEALLKLMGRRKATVVSDLAPETVAEVLA